MFLIVDLMPPVPILLVHPAPGHNRFVLVTRLIRLRGTTKMLVVVPGLPEILPPVLVESFVVILIAILGNLPLNLVMTFPKILMRLALIYNPMLFLIMILLDAPLVEFALSALVALLYVFKTKVDVFNTKLSLKHPP